MATPLSREERHALKARCLRDIEHRRIVGMTRETVEVDHLLALLDAEERAERAERVVALFRFLDEVDESTTASESLTGYVLAWDKVADLVESLDFDYLPVPTADDAKRGEE